VWRWAPKVGAAISGAPVISSRTEDTPSRLGTRRAGPPVPVTGTTDMLEVNGDKPHTLAEDRTFQLVGDARGTMIAGSAMPARMKPPVLRRY